MILRCDLVSLCAYVIMFPCTLGIDWNAPQPGPPSDLVNPQLTLTLRATKALLSEDEFLEVGNLSCLVQI